MAIKNLKVKIAQLNRKAQALYRMEKQGTSPCFFIFFLDVRLFLAGALN